VDQIGPHDLVVRYVCRPGPSLDPNRPFSGEEHLAARLAGLGLDAHRAPDHPFEVRPRPERAVEARRGDVDRVLVEVRPQDVRHALAERMVDTLRVVDVHAEPLLAVQLEREHLHPGKRGLDGPRDVALELAFLLVLRSCHCSKDTPKDEKWAPRAHLERTEMWWPKRVAATRAFPRSSRAS